MYHAPLKEFRFLLNQQFRVDQLAGYPRFADYSADLADSILAEAGRFAEEILEPINRSGDKEGARWSNGAVNTAAGFRDAYQRFVADGWPLLGLDVEHGGQGAPLALTIAAEEIWFGGNVAFMLCPQLGRGAVEALLMAGTTELRERFLPKMVTGEWTGTMNLTEPHAGSDLAVIRTRAQPAGDHYKLFGQKIFITYGEHDMADNIVHLVLARIDGSPAGVKGISLFVVPKRLPDAQNAPGAMNDVRCVSIEHKLGIHGSPTCVMSYGDNGGAIGYLVGEANRGLEYMFIMMNTARLSVGVQGIGLAEKALQQATDWARTRVQGRPIGVRTEGTPTIIQHPDVRRMLMMMKSSTEAARAMAIYAALQFDRADAMPDEKPRVAARSRGELLIPIVKGWCTEQVNDVASLGVQVHGGMGFIEETGAAQTLRDARITAIYEGTTAIQANDLLGRKLLRDSGAAMNSLLDDLTALLQQSGSDTESTRDIATAAIAAMAQLRRVSAQLVQLGNTAAPEAYAVSVPYLKFCGFVVGGALLAQAARIAAVELTRPGADADFLRAKIQTARFYMHHWLAQADALARVVEHGGGSVIAAEPALI
jgi:alkylation response protein AidB-like acyl-CoA dehydrogenase